MLDEITYPFSNFNGCIKLQNVPLKDTSVELHLNVDPTNEYMGDHYVCVCVCVCAIVG